MRKPATDVLGDGFSTLRKEFLSSSNAALTNYALDDYPVFCIPAAQATAAEPGSFGIVIGGSGNGEQMAANKVKGVRAALVWSLETAKLAREHNNANVISVGGRLHSIEDCQSFIDTFLATPFSGDERHIRRINQMSNFETTGKIK